MLYYIVSLHQTTTSLCQNYNTLTLYYIVSLHQTTTSSSKYSVYICCIISFLYIKPQLTLIFIIVMPVVLYRFSTSNHNSHCGIPLFITVVLYRFSTSNHNGGSPYPRLGKLYYIVSLHQTTTKFTYLKVTLGCIISFLYIKPQLTLSEQFMIWSCIISFLYIKPQL